jgi:hypothetical protein
MIPRKLATAGNGMQLSLKDARAVAAQPCHGGHTDRTTYQAIHFYSAELHQALKAAANYLEQLEADTGHPPNVLCLQDEYSVADHDTELAWKLTLVLGEM